MTDTSHAADGTAWRKPNKGLLWAQLHDLHSLTDVEMWSAWTAEVLEGDEQDQWVLRFAKDGTEIEVRYSHPSLAEQLARKHERGMRSAILDTMYPEIGLYRGHEQIRPDCPACGAVNSGNVDCAACVRAWPISEDSKAKLLAAIEARSA